MQIAGQRSAATGKRSATATALYLLRFDDLCPTMNWRVWDEIEAILVDYGVNPILAVVPDNRDSKLAVNDANPDFWNRAREWQRRGWTIALHGYQHRYLSAHAGIVGRRKLSEFAGVAKEEQANKLQKATQILRQERIESKVWVAPGHTFDEHTVSLLPEFGLTVISDGFVRYPFHSGNVTWVPQQLWEFRPVPPGIWTICFHHNDWAPAALRQFRDHVAAFSDAFISLDEALREARDFEMNRLFFKLPRCADFVMRAQMKMFCLGQQC